MDAYSATIDTSQYSELLAPEGNEDVGHMVFLLLADVLQNKDDLMLPEAWNRYYELRRNKHWQISPGAQQTVTLVTANLLGSHHRKTVNMLTDNNPTFNVAQIGEIPDEAVEAKDTVVRMADFWWRDQEQQSIFEESVHSGETYGSVAEKVLFNNDLEENGEIETVSIDPFYFGMWPPKVRKVQKAQAVLYYYPLSVRECQLEWPDHANEIRADEDLIKEIGDTRDEVVTGGEKPSRQGILTVLAGVFRSLVGAAQGATAEQANQTIVCECWVKDHTKDSQGEPKYDGNIRRVIALNGGNLVVSDDNNPSMNPSIDLEVRKRTYLFNKFPFSWTNSVIDPASPFGMADYEQLEGLNVEFNKSLSQFTLYKDKAARLKLINPQDSGVENDELDDYPGIIRPSSSMTSQAIRYLDPPQAPADIGATLEIYKDIFFLIAGTFELESAQTPGREVVAYKAIAALLENAARLLKDKTRNYQHMIRERGRMYISLAQHYYQDDRWVSYQEDGDSKAEPLRIETIRVPLRLTVVSGSTMPKSAVQQREEAIALHDKGAIDQIALLRAVDFPQWKEIVLRMQQGPYGILFESMAMVGVMDPLIQYFQQLSQIEPDKIEREIKAGNLPLFTDVLRALFEQDQVTTEVSRKEDAEMRKIEAEISNIEAERLLTVEKTVTERVEQYVKQEGVDLDHKQQTIERAKAVIDIQNAARQPVVDGASDKRKDDLKNREIALKSAEALVKHEDSKIQGPYREKGMKSNNA